jgi:2-polyprenyl-6-hydroxyphenyl methylase/3-demethylubiquinone-9 3-methyltransferase
VTDSSLTDRSSHFDFGKNWASYATLLDQGRIDEAVRGLERLCGGRIDGKSFLDVGCGSGLHSLSAAKLGAAKVLGLDLDSDSVNTTRTVMAKHAPSAIWDAREKSVFDLSPTELGQFDIVYSWGVLHHTGDMYRAIRCAAAMTKPGGQFVFALYRKTRSCEFWKVEKRWYAKASPGAQRGARAVYRGLFRVALALQGRSYRRYVDGYQSNRGMNFDHDVHDWLGGWPYESISPSEVDKFMAELGFARVRQLLVTEKQTPSGIFGSGCDEYVYQKRAT